MKILVKIDHKPGERASSEMRLNKYLSETGIFSRREADKLIEAKKLHINDRVANLGDRVRNGDSVFINEAINERKYFIYNKPRGEETKWKMLNAVRYDPIGRLDKESDGLLIYTNDFRIIEAMLSPTNQLEREYVIYVKETATPRVKTILERGVETQEGTYAPVKRVTLDEDNRHVINIVLTEGKKHEIRRMLNALLLTVTSLKRIRFEFLKLGNIKAGEMREFTAEQKTKLLDLLNLEA
jgi:23S rRNA pseudouridine2604 synthase